MTSTTTPAPLVFTDRAFRRSNGRGPSGSTMGTWAFQASLRDTAFSGDLLGDVVFVNMSTLAEAKRELRRQGRRGLWAVLP